MKEVVSMAKFGVEHESVIIFNNNNNNKTVLIKRLPPKSLSAKNTIQTITMYTNIKPK